MPFANLPVSEQLSVPVEKWQKPRKR